MEYSIQEQKDIYKVGNYFLNSRDDLFRIIKDRDRGFALLEVADGMIESEFHESIESLIKYTTLSEMKPLEQVDKATFRIV
ncbi:hypothetical protein WKH57_01195 [Niallia taxi]|uniref:hypothetical protein n=1 Tax=Niallia taxi TaxID=2499688 RepID=UPI00316F9CEF